MDQLIQLFSDGLKARLLALREELHRHPELSFEERETTRRLSSALAELGIEDISYLEPTGLIARVPGRDRSRPPVAVRGDIDALPIQEATGLAFASVNDGVMHACGHDVHASWAVGAAALLLERPAECDVLVVLQPAEETGRGAPVVLQSGQLEGCRAIVGGHVDRRFEVGEVVAQSGPLGAATDEFTIHVVGRGGHGARPQLCRDPVFAASAIVCGLQSIVSRRIDPGEPAVVTVGSFHAGSAPNVIPDRAELTGTLRSMSPDTRQQLAEGVHEIAAEIAAAHRVRADVEIRRGTPPVINDEAVSAQARAAAVELLGESAVVPLGQVNMGGEDFAFYSECMPATFLRIGAREPGGEPVGAHTPGFYAASEAILVGAAVLAETARRCSRMA